VQKYLCFFKFIVVVINNKSLFREARISKVDWEFIQRISFDFRRIFENKPRSLSSNLYDIPNITNIIDFLIMIIDCFKSAASLIFSVLTYLENYITPMSRLLYIIYKENPNGTYRLKNLSGYSI
jgi:hypothetical protein